ncbi:MAG TPA: hypothetical protein PLE16_12495 [Spirochaetota bacterium]|jgi:hypothetical protein|nr:hypothetical protein [Spirochaetota bacterium]HOH38053.1 hypothetical protein [Spirochaetota bacterium]HPJ15415.1 hypothetical protein [Spirochaetota bacterium]HPM35403.1 hypothetical protein [Spirochaetota bacterium]HPY03305.1 hypothetical protein [Spirochaetota bacterium]
MKKEYNFAKAEKGKYYTPAEQIELPIYLDKSIKDFYKNAALLKKIDLNKMVNSILKKEMEIHKDILIGK